MAESEIDFQEELYVINEKGQIYGKKISVKDTMIMIVNKKENNTDETDNRWETYWKSGNIPLSWPTGKTDEYDDELMRRICIARLAFNNMSSITVT